MKETNPIIDKKFFDVTFPILDKFKELAPGTFKHCQNVSSICESIGVELGLDVDLLKCAALYHDIGKMNNAAYFSENQSGDSNIHDDLDPYVSYQLITRHVGDSILHLIQIEDMPIEVVKVVSQHHGNAILQQFYCKTKGEPEEKYRYKCCKPISTEALILMIVDSVEATARALFNNNESNDDSNFIDKAINGTIARLMDDNQLDNMRIGTLTTTKKLLFKELESIYHKRVAYLDTTQTIGDLKKNGD